MQLKFMRKTIAAFAFSAIAAVSASAQIFGPPAYTDVELGNKDADKSYPLTMAAENRNCQQPLDFRFTSKTPWLRLPNDPVVRQVPAGQARDIQAMLDLTNVSPGRQQAFVDVECDNCGFFLFANCKIDKQQLRFLISVNAAGGPGAGAGPGQPGQPPAANASVDPNDPRLPPAVRARLLAANAALVKAQNALTPWADELKAAEDAAAQAKTAADAAAKADMDAADAEKKLKEAVAAEEKALKAAAEAAQLAKDLAPPAGISESEAFKEAKAAAAEAEKKAQAATKAKSDALNAAVAARAAAAATDAAALAKAAAEAQAAADAQKAKCEKEKAALAAAQAEAAAAEQEARDALAPKPQPPAASAKPTPEEIEEQRRKVQDCQEKLRKSIEDKNNALEALAEAGAFKDPPPGHQTELERWGKAVDGFMSGMGKLPPGSPLAPAQLALKTIGIVVRVGIAAGKTGNKHHRPGHHSHDPDATKKWLVKTGKAANSEQAERVYKEMEKFIAGGRSIEKMQKEVEKENEHCQGEGQKLKDMETAAKGK